MTEARAFIRHVHHRPPQGAGLCVKGVRNWFQTNGLDYRDFLRNGIAVSRLDALNDALGNRVAAAARADHEAKHGQE